MSTSSVPTFFHFVDTGTNPEWEFRILKLNGKWSLWYACKPNWVEYLKSQSDAEVRKIEQ